MHCEALRDWTHCGVSVADSTLWTQTMGWCFVIKAINWKIYFICTLDYEPCLIDNPVVSVWAGTEADVTASALQTGFESTLQYDTYFQRSQPPAPPATRVHLVITLKIRTGWKPRRTRLFFAVMTLLCQQCVDASPHVSSRALPDQCVHINHTELWGL